MSQYSYHWLHCTLFIKHLSACVQIQVSHWCITCRLEDAQKREAALSSEKARMQETLDDATDRFKAEHDADVNTASTLRSQVLRLAMNHWCN